MRLDFKLISAVCAGALAACTTPAPPSEPDPFFKVVSADIVLPDVVFDGYLLWHRSDELDNDVENATVLSDASGNTVHVWPTELTGGGTPAYLLADGRLARTGIRDRAYTRQGPIASVDTLQVVDKDGTIVWEASAEALGGVFFHHDFEPLPNGNFLVTTYRAISADDALTMGWDPLGANQVWTDGVYEIAPDFETGDAEIVWAWEFVDHLVQDINPNLENYGTIADHPERIDPNFPTNFAPRNTVRQHVNSVAYNADLEQILISSFIYNEIWIVDHSTTAEEARSGSGGRYGQGGRLLYRYGNPAAYGRGTASDRVFLKQHDANWVEAGRPGAGHVLVHNNNAELQPRRPNDGLDDTTVALNDRASSQVIELRLPMTEDGAYGLNEEQPFAAEVVWTWGPDDYFADFQGGARRLPNGSTLVTDTTDYTVFEVTGDGDIAATYSSNAPVYKAFKYGRSDVAELIED